MRGIRARTERRAAREPVPQRSAVKLAAGLTCILSIWLMAAPYVLGFAQVGQALGNAMIIGILLLILSGIRWSKRFGRQALSWVMLGLGVWLIIAPFRLEYSAVPAALWSDAATGFLIAVLSLWSAVAPPDEPQR